MQVVLATNVAESSITIPDIGVVIDFCLQRVSSYDEARAMPTLGLAWCDPPPPPLLLHPQVPSTSGFSRPKPAPAKPPHYGGRRSCSTSQLYGSSSG